MSISYDRTLTAHHISGWWYTYPSEKYEFVSWIYSSQYDGKNKKMFQTTNQMKLISSDVYQQK